MSKEKIQVEEIFEGEPAPRHFENEIIFREYKNEEFFNEHLLFYIDAFYLKYIDKNEIKNKYVNSMLQNYTYKEYINDDLFYPLIFNHLKDNILKRDDLSKDEFKLNFFKERRKIFKWISNNIYYKNVVYKDHRLYKNIDGKFIRTRIR